MNKAFAVVVGLLVLAMLLLFSSTFTVNYNQVAIQTRFGQADANSVIEEPGLNFKMPIFHKIATLDRRMQLVESPLEEISTADGLQIVVKAFLLWKVDTESANGPLAFFERYETTSGAAGPLTGRFRTAFTGVLSEYRFDQLVGTGSDLAAAEDRILADLTDRLADEGVQPVAVGLSQLMLPTKAAQAVVTRMKATRVALAGAEQSKGRAEAEAIIAAANTKSDVISSFAQALAEEIRAKGEEQSSFYLKELQKDEELAIFLEWLDALRTSLGQYTTLVVPTEFAPFHLMNMRPLRSGETIPMPPGETKDEKVSSAAPTTPAAEG